MINIFAVIFIIVHVVSSQVIPYGANTAGSGNIAGNIASNIASNTAGTYQLNTIPGLNLNNAAIYNGGANVLVNERISNGLENAALSKAHDASSLIGLAGNTLSSVNGNVATFDLGGDGRSFTITSGSPGPQGFGFQVQADALEVGGTVSVNGQIPIYGTVSVNGNVPTDGTAAVNYSCGKAGATPTA